MTEATSVHGTAIVLGDRGVLIRGASGSGKTALSLELLARARAAGVHAALVCDDQVLISAHRGRIIAKAATAIAGLIETRQGFGDTYEFGGPEVRSFRELMEFVLKTTGRNRMLVPLPFGLARLKASFLQFLPNAPLTPDQVELLRVDNVVSEQAKRDDRTLEGLGINPSSYEAIAPSYLWRFRKTGQFKTGRLA